MRPLSVVLISGAAHRLAPSLLASGHRLVGIAEPGDGRETCSRLRSLARAGYWLLTRGRRPPPVCRLAATRGISYFEMAADASESLVAWLRALAPDVVVTYYAPLLEDAVLSVPRHGAINLHPSLLPKYRGGHPLLWMYYDMDLTGGVTLNFLDSGIDTGDIIFQEDFEIRLGMSEREVEQLAIDELGVPLLLRALDLIASGQCPRVSQPKKSPTPFARRLPPREHWKMIDWERWPIERVWHFLSRGDDWMRGMEAPLPQAFARTWRLDGFERGAVDGKPGSVGRDRAGFFLAHGEGKLRLTLRFDGRKALADLVKAMTGRRPPAATRSV